VSLTSWLGAPAALALVPLAALAWGLLVLARRARGRRLARVIGPRASELAGDVDGTARRRRDALLAAGLVLALVALARPRWGGAGDEAAPRGVDLVVALDVSRSMLARDVLPDRLARAKADVGTLADRARGDRLALVAFAGEARLVIPLTQDVDTFARLLDDVDTWTVARGGTDLGAALGAALEALGGASGAHEAIVLVTDGEDLQGRGLRAARRARERGIVVHAAGYGSTRGSKIAVAGPGGETFLRDRAGRDVVTAMDPETLERLATSTGGAFFDAGAHQDPLVALYDEQVNAMARKPLDEGPGAAGRAPRFQWPLLLAVCAWLAGLSLPERRPGSRSAP